MPGDLGCKWIVSGLTLLAVLSVAAATPGESAETEHFFPLIADGDGFRSRLFLTNVSDEANSCALTLRGPGLSAGVFQSNSAVTNDGTGAMIDLGEAGASLTLASAGGSGLTFGYMKLDCAGPAAARMLLSLENGGTLLSLATLESARPGRSFQFPVLPRLGRLAMVFSNEAGLDAACAAELEGGAGASLGGGDFAVPAASTALRFLDELIPTPDGFEAGKVRVSCGRDVAAVALPLNGAVFTAMPAVLLDGDAERSSHILPLLQDGGGFRSRLLLTNLAESANSCSIDLRGGALEAGRFEIPAGAAVSGSSVTLELDAGGDQASLASTGVQSLAYGYAAVECDGPVDARNLLTADAGDNPAGMAVVTAAQSADGLEFPVAPGLGRLALAMNNDAESAASCAVELRAGGETVAGTGLFQISGRSTLVRFLEDLFAAPEDFTGGIARLSCYSAVTAASLLDGGPVFAAAPPAVVPVRPHPESARTIPDGNLRILISRQLDKVPGAALLPDDLAALRSLDASDAGIESLEGLQHAAGLTGLALGYAYYVQRGHSNSNRVRDLSPILGLSNLETLDLTGNELSGPIPSGLGQLGSLWFLNLGDNRLAGDIPEELAQLSSLSYLALFNNQLSGSIPPELGQLGNLRYLYLGNNQLGGSIPAELGQLANLRYLNLRGNQLAESIPAELGQLSNLESLNFRANELSGSIPSELGQLSNLVYLYLNGNELSGSIPPELGQLANLYTLNLNYNELSGSIPAELGQLANLGFLGLSGNQLNGSIPAELGQLSNLTTLDVSGNSGITGTLPSEIRERVNSGELKVNYNGTQISGFDEYFALQQGIGDAEGIAYANGKYYVVNDSDDKVYAFDTDGGRDVVADFDLHADNSSPTGITWADGLFHVVDWIDEKVYAYTASGERDVGADFDLHADNDDPAGIAFAGGRLHVVDWTDEKVYAYNADGRRDAAAEFDLHGENSFPSGIAYANDRFYVVNEASFSFGQVYAYTRSGQHDPSASFNLIADNTGPSGIVSIDSRILVVDSIGEKIFAYTTTGQHRGAADIGFPQDNGDPEGIAFAGGRLRVVDSADQKAYAYTAAGGRDAAADFDLDADNADPVGITSAGGRLHVVDWATEKVYAYNANGQRNIAADFNLHQDNDNPSGIVWTGDLFHVVDASDKKVYAYTATGRRDVSAEFNLHADNDEPAGITWVDGVFYVADQTFFSHKVYAYTDSGQRHASGDFELHEDNRSPTGITWADGRFHVVDDAGDKVYSYSGSGES